LACAGAGPAPIRWGRCTADGFPNCARIRAGVYLRTKLQSAHVREVRRLPKRAQIPSHRLVGESGPVPRLRWPKRARIWGDTPLAPQTARALAQHTPNQVTDTESQRTSSIVALPPLLLGTLTASVTCRVQPSAGRLRRADAEDRRVDKPSMTS
jgi:hypothetical protein